LFNFIGASAVVTARVPFNSIDFDNNGLRLHATLQDQALIGLAVPADSSEIVKIESTLTQISNAIGNPNSDLDTPITKQLSAINSNVATMKTTVDNTIKPNVDSIKSTTSAINKNVIITQANVNAVKSIANTINAGVQKLLRRFGLYTVEQV
jgi:hypothetical protein